MGEPAGLTPYLDVFTILRRRFRSEGGNVGWPDWPHEPLDNQLVAEAARVTSERHVDVSLSANRWPAREPQSPGETLIETAIRRLKQIGNHPPLKDGEWLIVADELKILIRRRRAGQDRIANILGGELAKKMSAEVNSALVAGEIQLVGWRNKRGAIVVAIPMSMVQHLLNDKFGVIVQPTRIVGPSPDRRYGGLLLYIRTSQLEGWLAKRGRSVKIRNRGRPRIEPTTIDPTILELIDAGEWDGRTSPVTRLHELLIYADIEISLPTLRREIDRLAATLKRPELQRKKNNRAFCLSI